MLDQDFLTSREAALRARITRQGMARWCVRYPDLARRVGGRWRINAVTLDRILRGEAPLHPPAVVRAPLIAAVATTSE